MHPGRHAATLALVLLLVPRTGGAADYVVAGKKLLVKTPPAGAAGNRALHLGTGAAIAVGQEGGPGDPRCVGAGGGGASSIRIAGAGGDVTIPLPCVRWSLNGSKTAYTYKDTSGATCKLVLVRSGALVKAVCKGSVVTLSPPFSGEVGVLLTLGSGSKDYCASFGGQPVKNGPAIAKRKDAPAPDACPVSPCVDDGDGWTTCDNDCCDSPFECPSPALVNPGALEIGGNLVDDDCDRRQRPRGLRRWHPEQHVDGARLCEGARPLPDDDGEPGDARAEDVGRDRRLPAARRRHGHAGGQLAIDPLNVRERGLAVGRLRARGPVERQRGDSGPVEPAARELPAGTERGHVECRPGRLAGRERRVVPERPGLSRADRGPDRQRCRHAQGARASPHQCRSFSVGMFFYSAEYPEWVCSPFNDFFLTLLDSSFVPGVGEMPNPADKNLD